MNLRLMSIRGRHLGLCVVLAAMVTGLSGCGGGGSSNNTPTTIDAASGFYDNASNNGGADVYSDSTNTTALHISDLEAMVSGKQLMLMSVSQNVQWVATLTSLSGTAYTADVRIYQNQVPYGTATLKGTLTAGTSITGTLTGTGYGQGTFSLDISAANSQQADVATIMRVSPNVWQDANNIAGLSFYVDSAGNVTNNGKGVFLGFFIGCKIVGTVVAIPNSALYQMQLTMSSCTSTAEDDTYTGYVTTRSASSTNDTLVVMLQNSTHAYSMYDEFQ